MQPQATPPLSDRELLDLITGHIQEVFWVADAKIEVILFISQGYERVFGRTRESLLANPRSFLDAVHADDRARVLGDLAGQPEGIAFEHEYRIIRPDGSIRWVWDRGIPVWATDGSLRFFVGAALDITRLKAAEAVLLLDDAALVMLGWGPWADRLRERDREPRFAGRHFTLPPVHPDLVPEWTTSADVSVIAGRLDDLSPPSPPPAPSARRSKATPKPPPSSPRPEGRIASEADWISSRSMTHAPPSPGETTTIETKS